MRFVCWNFLSISVLDAGGTQGVSGSRGSGFSFLDLEFGLEMSNIVLGIEVRPLVVINFFWVCLDFVSMGFEPFEEHTRE